MFMNDLERYGLLFVVVIAVTYVANKYKIRSSKSEEENEYDLIRTYLLNESPLYGYNKPKLWVHTKYEFNARQWKSFGSRTSTDLNQPYIHLTVKSLINFCGDDFNIWMIIENSPQSRPAYSAKTINGEFDHKNYVSFRTKRGISGACQTRIRARFFAP